MTSREDRKGTRVFGSPPEEPALSRPSLSPHVSREILKYVRHAIARFGSADEVELNDEHLVLRSRTGTRSVSIEPWLAEWTRLEERAREKRALEIARELIGSSGYLGRRGSVESTPPRRVIFLDPRALLALALLLACGLWITFSEDLARGRANSDSEGSDSQLIADRADATVGSTTDDRNSRVCRETISRVFQGGSVSAADVDGWRVEVAIAKRGAKEPLDTHPAIRQFVQDPSAPEGSRFIWNKEPDFASIETRESLVRVTPSSLSSGAERIETITLTFGGALVDSYFSELGRARYFHTATALSEALHATHGAVYARCYDQHFHALGSWFRGLDTGGAAAALVYYMGTYASPLHLATPYAKLPGREELNRLHAFTNVAERTAHLSREDLATLVGHEGGMALGKPGGEVVITFPFQDGNRASRASRSIARVTSLAPVAP